MHLRPYRGILPTLGERVYVDPAATCIGDVVLGDDVSLWPGVVVRGDVNYIRIGARSNVQDGTVIHVSHDGPHAKLGGFATQIGADVTLGHTAIIHACRIEDAVLVGTHALVERARRRGCRPGACPHRPSCATAAGLHALDHHVARLAEDHDRAARLAAALSALGVEVTGQHTNMVFVQVAPASTASLVEHMAGAGVRLSPGSEGKLRLVLHLDVDDAGLKRVVDAWAGFRG